MASQATPTARPGRPRLEAASTKQSSLHGAGEIGVALPSLAARCQEVCSRLEEGVPGGDREERSSKQSLMLNSCRPSGMQLMRLRVLLALGI